MPSLPGLSIGKTWDYKGKGGFLPTKNKTSVRKIQIDWQTVVQFSELIKDKLTRSMSLFSSSWIICKYVFWVVLMLACPEVNWDWLILLVAKTGMRFSEALAITPKDFDFSHQALSIAFVIFCIIVQQPLICNSIHIAHF